MKAFFFGVGYPHYWHQNRGYSSHLLKGNIIVKGVEGLANGTKKLYVASLSCLGLPSEYERIGEIWNETALGSEAVYNIDKKYKIQGKIALKTSLTIAI